MVKLIPQVIVYNLHLNKDDNDEDDPMVENYKKNSHRNKQNSKFHRLTTKQFFAMTIFSPYSSRNSNRKENYHTKRKFPSSFFYLFRFRKNSWKGTCYMNR
jgi:hypothetical protein